MHRLTLRASIPASLCILVLAGTGCSLDTFRSQAARNVAGNPEQLTYAPELGVNLQRMKRTDSGLYYFDHTVGNGTEATYGKAVQVAYRGWLANGHLFDQSAERPIEFTLGEGEVIRGWDEGIAGMRVGGRRLLVIPPSQAYGDQSPGGGIPPNATLVFDVTLAGVEQ